MRPERRPGSVLRHPAWQQFAVGRAVRCGPAGFFAVIAIGCAVLVSYRYDWPDIVLTAGSAVAVVAALARAQVLDQLDARGLG
jgi:hypothetical protein